MNKTWLYHYDPDTKQQSMEWWHSGSPCPKKFRVKKSAGKFLVSIFWDQDSIFCIHYLPKGQTINTEYYSSLLVQLKDVSKEKCRRKVTKGVLFLHDNALAHQALATQKKLGHHFLSNAEVTAAAETWLDGQPAEFFFEWLAEVRAMG